VASEVQSLVEYPRLDNGVISTTGMGRPFILDRYPALVPDAQRARIQPGPAMFDA
jgi:hypothetical protein